MHILARAVSRPPFSSYPPSDLPLLRRQAPLSTRLGVSTRAPSYTHVCRRTLGEDKTGPNGGRGQWMGVGARHECEEGRTARVSSPSSLSSCMSSLLAMAASESDIVDPASLSRKRDSVTKWWMIATRRLRLSPDTSIYVYIIDTLSRGSATLAFHYPGSVRSG